MSSRGGLPTLAEIVLEQGLASQAQLNACQQNVSATGQDLVCVLIEDAEVSETALAEALSKRLELPQVELSGRNIPAEALRAVSLNLARRYQVMPVEAAGGALTLAMINPTNRQAMRDVAASANLIVEPCVAAWSDVRKAIKTHYSGDTMIA